VPSPVLAVLNMKGGVGKTTISAHVSREIFEMKVSSVLLIDLDPQYNLTQQLIARDAYNKLVETHKTVLRLFEPAPAADFFDINTSPSTPPKAVDVSVQLRHFTHDKNIQLSLIPGNFELTKYSFIPDNDKLKHAREYFKRFISAARADYKLIVLDMNPSSSFLTFAGLSVATDIISPVRPDKYSVLGLELVKRLLDHPAISPKPNMHIVMNGVPRRNPVTTIEQQILTEPYFGPRLLPVRLHESGVLKARSDYTGFASERRVSRRAVIKLELRKVGLELCNRVGL
jgi:chromosome partitioning protein